MMRMELIDVEQRLQVWTIGIVLTIIVVVVLSAWSPWLTPAFSQKLVVHKIEKLTANVLDGCGIQCTDCGVKGVTKAPFGSEVIVDYNCGGPRPIDKSNPNRSTVVYVSFIGSVDAKVFEH